jgi:hypothetical protein
MLLWFGKRQYLLITYLSGMQLGIVQKLFSFRQVTILHFVTLLIFYLKNNKIRVSVDLVSSHPDSFQNSPAEPVFQLW